jgi:hypothetical protein
MPFEKDGEEEEIMISCNALSQNLFGRLKNLLGQTSSYSRTELGIFRVRIKNDKFNSVLLLLSVSHENESVICFCLHELHQRLTTLWASMACYRDSFTFYLLPCTHMYPVVYACVSFKDSGMSVSLNTLAAVDM